jgi:RNA polymerase sigma factor (sigma-70 family)
MPTTRQAGSSLGQTLVALLPADGGHLSDDQLLARFVGTHDQRAFASLVKRHGPMVLGVCRRVLRHAQDAEDAFQATFLILARKAASAVPRGAVGNWLYGVAYRTALEARSMSARRRQRERPLDNAPHPETAPPEPRPDVLAALDRELSRLPDKYRQPVVLCELQGRTRKDVARQLGLPEGTLSWRLAAARKMLARRLARYGPEVAGAALVAVLADGASARVPAPLVGATVRAAAGVVPARVAALSQEVLKAMLVTRLTKGTALLFLLGLLTFACGALARPPADRPGEAPADERAAEGDPPAWRDDPLYRVSASLVGWWPADGHAYDLVGSRHGKLVSPVGFDKGCRGRAFSFVLPKGGDAKVGGDAKAPLAGVPELPVLPPHPAAPPVPGVPPAPALPAPALPGSGPPAPGVPPAPALPAPAVPGMFLWEPPTGEVTLTPSELTDTFTMTLWVYPTATACLTDNGDSRWTGSRGGGKAQRYAVLPTHGGLDGKRAGCGISVGTNGVGVFEHTHDNCPCAAEHKAEIKGWTHVAVAYAKGTPTLYVNGKAVKTGTKSQWIVFPGLAFGDNQYNYGPYYGLIDEATLFSRSLTAEEIKVVMRATGPEKPAPAAASLSDTDCALLWSALGGKQSPRGLFAVERLAAGGDEAVRRLRERLLPKAAVDRRSVDELIARLDDDAFDTREHATRSLKERGFDIVPKLRDALKTSPSAEVRKRLEEILRHMNDETATPEELRAVRAIAALGRIDTAASRALLAEIAQGPEARPRTVAARGTLAQAETAKKASEK